MGKAIYGLPPPPPPPPAHTFLATTMETNLNFVFELHIKLPRSYIIISEARLFYKRNIKHLPCLHSLMQTLKWVWETSKVCVNPRRGSSGLHKHSRSPKLPLVFASGYVNTVHIVHVYFLNPRGVESVGISPLVSGRRVVPNISVRDRVCWSQDPALVWVWKLD